MDGIKVTPLREIFNEKGNIFHALKVSEPDFYNFGEAYFSSVKKDVVKGWKKHIEMKMNLVVIVGQIKIVVYDDIKNSFFEIVLSRNNYKRLTINNNLWVAFMGLDEENILLNISSIEHDPSEAKNLKLSKIDYNWNK